MPAAALVGAIGSIAGGLLNNSLSSSAATTAFNRQKELMRMQQQYAVENWNREVSYNDPRAQMQRLKAAGLNPNLVYGSGSPGLNAPSTASPTAPSAPMQVTAPADFGSVISNAAQAASALANAKLADSKTIGQKIENDFNQKTLSDRILAVGKQNNWTDEQISKTQEETANLQQQFALLVGQSNLMQKDGELKQKAIDSFDQEFSKRMREYDDKHNLSKEEYRRLRDTYDDFIRATKASSDESEINSKMADLIYQNESSFAETERKLGLFGMFIKLMKACLK